MGIAITFRTAALAASAALFLGACATPASIAPGQPIAAANKLGAPALDIPLPHGGHRFIWTSQPMGQFAWAIETDAGNRVLSNTQVLTSENFDRIQPGEWDTDKLRYEFGPPAEITRVGLRGEHIVWGYRFRQDGVWNSLMYIYVDDAGKVVRFHPGPDPLAEQRRFPF